MVILQYMSEPALRTRIRRGLLKVEQMTAAALLPFVAAVSVHEPAAAQDPVPAAARPVFATSDQCIACHSNIVDDDGADISSMYRKRPFATHGQGRRPARAAGCRIPCRILCLARLNRTWFVRGLVT